MNRLDALVPKIRLGVDLPEDLTAIPAAVNESYLARPWATAGTGYVFALSTAMR